MASKNLINLGISPDSGTGDSARRGGEKINNLFADIYANLGDNPVITDTSDPLYGTRKVFAQTEYKVGEIHTAGKYTLVEFETPTSTPGGSGYTFSNISNDAGWFLLARGDQIGSIINTGSSINLVLPLAVVGDTIRVKDINNTWSGKTIKIWTTPYENALNTTNWKANTLGTGSLTAPDQYSVSVSYTARNSYSPARSVVPYKSTNFTPAWSNTSLSLVISPIQKYTELVFVYHGPTYGWHLTQLLGVDEFQHFIGEHDSDLAIVHRQLDSDEKRLQTLDSELRDLRKDVNEWLDSEASERINEWLIQLAMLDSDSAFLQTLSTKLDANYAYTNARLDSDYIALNQYKIETDSRMDSEYTRINVKIKQTDSDVGLVNQKLVTYIVTSSSSSNSFALDVDSDMNAQNIALTTTINTKELESKARDLTLNSRADKDSDLLVELFEIVGPTSGSLQGEVLYWKSSDPGWAPSGDDLLVNETLGIQTKNIYPISNTTYNLGTSSLRWANVFALNGDFAGNVTLGDAATDTVSFNSRVNTSINPSTNNTHSLGLSGLQWIGHFSTLNVYTALNSNGNTVLGDGAGDTVTFNGRVNSSVLPSADVSFDFGSAALRWSTVHSNNLTVYNALAVNGNTTLGDAVSDTLTVNARVNSSFNPTVDNTYDLGAASLRWRAAYATNFYGQASSATYADLAEKYTSDVQYESGTVVVFGGTHEVTTTDMFADTRVAGIVSTNPAYLMNSELENGVEIALVGRVPCKVIGEVRKGDLLVTSSVKGYAAARYKPEVGTVVGKALEDKFNPEPGVIEVAVVRG